MIVPADPMVSVPTEGVVALGIVGREIVADPVAILIESANVQCTSCHFSTGEKASKVNNVHVLRREEDSPVDKTGFFSGRL